jgi:hypothetical protein
MCSSKARKRTVTAAVLTLEDLLLSLDPKLVQPSSLEPARGFEDYAPHIVSMVSSGCTPRELTNHLRALRTQVASTHNAETIDREVAKAIVRALNSLHPSNNPSERTRS